MRKPVCEAGYHGHRLKIQRQSTDQTARRASEGTTRKNKMKL